MVGKKNKNKSNNQEASAASPSQQDQGDRGNTGGAQGAAASDTPAFPMMECEICNEEFDTKDHKPRNLQCGHSFCTACCEKLKEHNSIICPNCRRKTSSGKSVEELPVNYLVVDLITSIDDAAASQNEKSASQRGKETSPHGGRCLEARAEMSMYCAFCHMWLCKDCSRIDHRRPECLLTPFEDTMLEKRQAGLAKVKSTENFMKGFSREAKAYDGKLRSFAALMEIALDCVKKEQHHLAGIRDHSHNMEQEIRALSEGRLPTDLEEAVFFLDTMEEATGRMQKWAADATAFLKGEQVSKLSKTLLQTVVQMHVNHNTHASGEVMALHSLKGVDVYLPVEMDGGRLLVHAAAARNGVPQTGCRVIKLEHIKSCIDPSRALTFLDISLGGQKLGRVFIRLLGCTKQSQCFLMMCTGETGPSFINTRFHRLWWRNLPGEHVWAGDHNRGDGSGGTLSAEILREIKDLSEIRTKVTITPGLVAGRYGRSNSSIFRVYTKSSDAVEEAAFGRIEYGFHILKSALEINKNITETTISGCGVVVES